MRDSRPGVWLAWTFSTSPLQPLNRIERNLTGSKISTSSTNFVFFGSIRRTRWPPWPLIGWDILDFSSEAAERNSTKLYRKQDLNVRFQVGVFWKLGKTRWPPSFWLAETFSISTQKPLNRIQRNLTGSKMPTSSTNFVFLDRSEKQDGRDGLWLAETIVTSSLKPLNGNQWNLTGNKISTFSTQFVFYVLMGKQDGRPDLWLAEIFFYFPSSTAERNNETW